MTFLTFNYRWDILTLLLLIDHLLYCLPMEKQDA